MEELKSVEVRVSEVVAPSPAKPGVEAGEGTWKIDFGRPVAKAFAWLSMADMTYSKDHHVREIKLGATVTKIDGSIVYGNWYAGMHDDSHNWAGAAVTIICHAYFK